MQIIVIIFFVIILFIILLLSLSNGEDQKRIAGKEGELQAKKILNHYLNENDLLLNNVNISIHGRNTELDYVVINNNGIFIFEVKNFSGKLVGNEDDQYWNKYKISRGNKEYIKEIRNPIN